MDFSLCVEEYSHAKPHPEPYLAGLRRFGGVAHEALVIEDSQRGLTSAVAAGIECAVVHNDFTATQDYSAATHRIKTLQELRSVL
ncbi:MAG: HAD-IA family hydrolase [Epsilonproteobacteria bacterium]|nr:HAD-IA family hydrolase [Campylobacterota bacterium]